MCCCYLDESSLNFEFFHRLIFFGSATLVDRQLCCYGAAGSQTLTEPELTTSLPAAPTTRLLSGEIFLWFSFCISLISKCVFLRLCCCCVAVRSPSLTESELRTNPLPAAPPSSAAARSCHRLFPIFLDFCLIFFYFLLNVIGSIPWFFLWKFHSG